MIAARFLPRREATPALQTIQPFQHDALQLRLIRGVPLALPIAGVARADQHKAPARGSFAKGHRLAAIPAEYQAGKQVRMGFPLAAAASALQQLLHKLERLFANDCLMGIRHDRPFLARQLMRGFQLIAQFLVFPWARSPA